MQIRFLYDRDTGQPHIHAHGVSEVEVIEVFQNRPLVVHGRRNSLLALGQTFAGRYLKWSTDGNTMASS
jgi:hypothetical protein